MPNNYEQFIEWQFLEICIVVKHSRWKKLQYKKAEAEAVFNATKKFEEHKFYENCLKMPNSYEQLLNGKTTSSEPSQSF